LVDAGAALAAAKQIDEGLGLIAKLLGKLRAQPDMAAVKLSAALDEIVKTYRAVDEAFTGYVSLAIDKDALTGGSQRLLSIAGGRLGVQVAEGLGHCSEIGNIYAKHLKRWFEKALNGEEQKQMEQLFIWPGGLADADETLFRALAGLADQLGNDARDVLHHVMQNDQGEARSSVLRTYAELAPVQQAMAKGMQSLFSLKNSFVQIAGTTT